MLHKNYRFILATIIVLIMVVAPGFAQERVATSIDSCADDMKMISDDCPFVIVSQSFDPDSYNLTTRDPGASQAQETLDEVLDWINEACGGKAWMISLGRNGAGEVVVKNAVCLD